MLKDNTMLPHHHSARGITLLEMLLAIGIIGLLMMMASKVSTDYIQQRTAQAAGQTIYRMADIVEDTIFRTSPTIPGPSSNVLSRAHGAFIGADMYKNLSNNDFDIMNPKFMIARSSVDVLYGINTTSGGPGGGQLLIRTMVVLTKSYPINQAVKMARAIGSRGAVIRYDQPGIILSAYGNWSYPMSPEVLNSLSDAHVSMPPPTGEAYVLSYRAMAPSDTRGPYVNIYGDDGGNVMHADLLMNGNSIVKAKDLEAGTVTATKAARFDQLAVNGNANFQGGIDANDSVTVGGDLNVTNGDMSVTNGNLKVPGGNVSAKGLRADTLEADDLTTKDISTQTLTVNGGNTVITSNLTVSGGASLDITGPLKASVVDADTVTTSNMKTQTMDVKKQTTLSGETTINNTANIDQLVLDGCMNMGGKTYGGPGC